MADYQITEEFVNEWNRIRNKVDGANGPGVHNTPNAITHGGHEQVIPNGTPAPIAIIKVIEPISSSSSGQYHGKLFYGQSNNDPDTAIEEDDIGKTNSYSGGVGSGTPPCEIWNLNELLPTNPSMGTVLGILGGYNKTDKCPIYFANFFAPLYGTLTTPWTPGTNTCTLQPCINGINNAAITDPDTGDDVDTVVCYVAFPLLRNAQCLGADEGDILAYVPLNFQTDGETALVLWQPPLIPYMQSKYQGIYNNSDGYPSLVADFLRAAAIGSGE